MVIGLLDTTVEAFEENIKTTHEVTAKLYYTQYAYVMVTNVRNNAGGCENKVNFRVYDDALYRPTITLLDDVSTWRAGNFYEEREREYPERNVL